ncbi:MAG: aminotransferase class IV [Gaiellaceae bacterium]
MSEPIVYLNGDYVPLSDAKISVLDQGFLLGDGIFDVVSAWKGIVFKLDEHVDRLFLSLRAAGLQSTLDHQGWKTVILETVRRCGFEDASIRFIVTRGIPREIISDPREHDPTEIVWAAPYIFLADDEKRTRGIRLGISHLRGFSPDTLDPRYKALDRLHFQLARLEVVSGGYDDVIWLNASGCVAEGPASNVFVVRDGALYTPGDEILRGITRQTFLELAERDGVPVREASLTAFDLYSADEVFTTSTAGGALPVREVAGRELPGPVPGPVTQQLDEAYWRMRNSGEHGTPI